jgi:hypothetical protein
MASSGQVVNLVVLLFFVVVGAIVEVFVSLLLGALVCVLPLVAFVMFSPTTRSSSLAGSLRRSPVTLLAAVVGASGSWSWWGVPQPSTSWRSSWASSCSLWVWSWWFRDLGERGRR